MDKDSVINALVALTNRMERRSKIAQLRAVYPYIEEAKRAGYKNSTIVETLNDQGFDLTLKSFEMLLYRVREETKAAEPSASTSFPSQFQSEKGTRQSQSTTSIPSRNWSTGQGGVESGHSEESSGFGSHNPAALDKIIGSKPDLTGLEKLGKRKMK